MAESKDDQLASTSSGESTSSDWTTYRYKRTIVPTRVVVGYLGDFGADIPYLNRQDMMQDIRRSIRFCESWLRRNVLGHLFANTRRLQRNLRRVTREPQYRDIVLYEQYLRWNVEFRFKDVATLTVIQTLFEKKVPKDMVTVILEYCDLAMSASRLWWP
jgi:hypothetical protein